MLRPLLSIVLMTLSVAACARDEERTADKPTAQAASSTQAATPASEASPPAIQRNEIEQATAAQESSGDATAEERSDHKLERLAALPAAQQLPSGRWTAGKHYQPVVPAQPTNVAPGKVEVLEFFWYGCPHCYGLEPFIDGWLQKKAGYIEFARVPIMWGPVHQAQARLYYTLQTLGRLDLHKKAFETVQENHTAFAGRDPESTLQAQLEFAKANGIDAKAYSDAFRSFSVNSSLQRADQAKDRYSVQAVPLVVVNGKYITEIGEAGGHEQLISLINDLAAGEHKK